MARDRFLLSAQDNFYHDFKGVTFTRDLLGQLFDRLHWMGVRRVYWYYYPMGFWDVLADGAFPEGWATTRESLDNLGDPMVAASPLVRERGMEFYAVIKPYETGFTYPIASGSTEADRMPGLPGIGGTHEVDPWVLARPELRVRARIADLPVGLENVPIERIQLRQKDMSPVRISAQELQIWTSPDNGSYRKRHASFTLSESVETCSDDVYASKGELVTRKGGSVRVLNISGISLMDPFVALTTSFEDDVGTFKNTALDMVRAFGPEGRPLDTVLGTYKGLLPSNMRRPGLVETDRDIRTSGLCYDAGQGNTELCLDASNRAGSTDGVVGIARGRNEYLSGALCEAYPEVQSYYMSWVGECIAAGVDGVDVRFTCHSSGTDYPDIYGFNEPLAAEYERRYGVNPDVEPYEPELLAGIRGEFLDGFLRLAKKRLAAVGKRFQLHLEADAFRPDALPRSIPGRVAFNWRSWLRSGLADEATLAGELDDPEVREMLREARAAGVPVHLRDSGFGNDFAYLDTAYQDEAVDGYVIYEAGSMLDWKRFKPGGPLLYLEGVTESIRDRAAGLGIVD